MGRAGSATERGRRTERARGRTETTDKSVGIHAAFTCVVLLPPRLPRPPPRLALATGPANCPLPCCARLPPCLGRCPCQLPPRLPLPPPPLPWPLPLPTAPSPASPTSPLCPGYCPCHCPLACLARLPSLPRQLPRDPANCPLACLPPPPTTPWMLRGAAAAACNYVLVSSGSRSKTACPKRHARLAGTLGGLRLMEAHGHAHLTGWPLVSAMRLADTMYGLAGLRMLPTPS